MLWYKEKYIVRVSRDRRHCGVRWSMDVELKSYGCRLLLFDLASWAWR